MLNNCMLDLETLGTAPGCPVLSIGAVMFDPALGLLGRTFYVNVSVPEQHEAGLVNSPSTEKWWSEQSAVAKARLHNPYPQHPLQAFTLFRDFLTQNRAKHLWGHGAGFDQPILRAAADAFKVVIPCQFWDDRDTRTLYALAKTAPDRSNGVHHDSLVDALVQTHAVFEGYASLGLTDHGFWERLRMVRRQRKTGLFYEQPSYTPPQSEL